MVEVQPDEIEVVLYHGYCPDGFTAAWAAHRRLGAKAEYYPCHHDALPPDLTGKVVALVDICFRPEWMKQIVKSAKRVIVLDHHETPRKSMEGFEGADLRFDMSKSGAMMSWEYFHPDEPAPLLVEAVMARDIWTDGWIEKYAEYLAGLDSYGYKAFDDLDYYTGYDEESVRLHRGQPKSFQEDMRSDNVNFRTKALVEIGTPIWRYMKLNIDSHVDRAVSSKLADHDVMVVNCSSPKIVSLVGHGLLKKAGISAMWWYDHHNNNVVVSLRARPGFDVAVIAESFGGGGHVLSSAFRVPIEDANFI